MTEAEWSACTDPQAMLGLLRGRASGRKLRLFAVACCRRVWPLLTDERSRMAVEVAESYADGVTTAVNLADAFYQANIAANAADPTDACTVRASSLASYVAYTAVGLGVDCTFSAADAIADTIADVAVNAIAYRKARHEELVAQCQLLRDIFDPFRRITGERSLLTSRVIQETNQIYSGRAFDRMPILADALEDAGCTDPDLLAHCRGPGQHVRGCWVVDLLTGRE